MILAEAGDKVDIGAEEARVRLGVVVVGVFVTGERVLVALGFGLESFSLIILFAGAGGGGGGGGVVDCKRAPKLEEET